MGSNRVRRMPTCEYKKGSQSFQQMRCRMQTLQKRTDLGSTFLFWEQGLSISICLCAEREKRSSGGSSQALPPLLLLLPLLQLLLLSQGIGLALLPALLLPLLLPLILLKCDCLRSLICSQGTGSLQCTIYKGRTRRLLLCVRRRETRFA